MVRHKCTDTPQIQKLHLYTIKSKSPKTTFISAQVKVEVPADCYLNLDYDRSLSLFWRMTKKKRKKEKVRNSKKQELKSRIINVEQKNFHLNRYVFKWMELYSVFRMEWEKNWPKLWNKCHLYSSVSLFYALVVLTNCTTYKTLWGNSLTGKNDRKE